MPELCFEWDATKNETNIAKHRISFPTVARAMVEKPYLSLRSDRGGEERHVSIIEIQGKLFAVIHVQRGEAIRIISARRARKDEEQQYRALFAR
ncbi:BrnT family toxin [Azorhizobium caulinodans]|nr:BrnT family toxin [Azorhizobium caulinodans]